MAQLHDFGEKIGGARKDLWKSRGLLSSDLSEMTNLERDTLVRKENIWLKPDWTKLIASGTPQCVAYWQSQMRLALPPKPPGNDPDSQHNYIEVVRSIRDLVMAVQTPEEIDSFYKDVFRPNYMVHPNNSYYHTLISSAHGIITSRVMDVAQKSSYRMEKEADRKMFGIPTNQQAYVYAKKQLSVHKYDEDQVHFLKDESAPRNVTLVIGNGLSRSFCYLKEDRPFSDPKDWQKDTYFVYDRRKGPVEINFAAEQEALDYVENYAREEQKQDDLQRAQRSEAQSRKKRGAFVPPQLQHLSRTGPDYRNRFSANSGMFLRDLKFRGGEFGNWLNTDDRQASLNMAYDALRDLARVLEIRPEDVSLNGSLAIAFGSRGRGGANAGAAHYEPERQVINLTKMSGAGCLAHEWGHALDHALGISLGYTGLASEQKTYKLPEVFRELLHAMQYKTVPVSQEDLSKEIMPQIEHCKTNIRAWIDGEKPEGLPDKLSKTWDSVVEGILSSAASFTGEEYMQSGKDAQTKPEIELLSKIRKSATNRGLPRNVKQQIVLWSKVLKEHEAALVKTEPTLREVETDFYKSSKIFDGQYSRMGHGYWSSTCEMFARAFDCYISDKLNAEGEKSEYLTAYADSFRFEDAKTGEQISAIPLNEERKLLNEKFDALLEDFKERGILTQYQEVKNMPDKEKPCSRAVSAPSFDYSDHKYKYEQISFDDLFRNAEQKREQQVYASKPPSPERTR